jgi:tRNA-splicing ligase RtcB (3'-phosphate/5'-hydroxy nucleic acid ligase)
VFVYKDKGQLPVKSWVGKSELQSDPELKEQLANLAKLPFAYHHVALMPDGHLGYGMPIGGVLATRGVVVPNAVGVDIGCGMQAVPVSTTNLTTPSCNSIIEIVKEMVPVGFNSLDYKASWAGFDSCTDIPIIQQNIEKASYQLGTLGGGNHFIEIQQGSDGLTWIMVHSGSRNLGYTIASHYHEKAKNLGKMWHTSLPTEDLSFLPLGTTEAVEYLRAMNFAMDYAYKNRCLIIEQVKNAFKSVIPDVSFGEKIDVPHNYATRENHFGENVLIHRKGAILARKNWVGIIPGSQGSKSYIVNGKGNPESFTSCSHGSGRKMSRKRAKKELNLEKEQKNLNDQGIIHSVTSNDKLDEAPGAYKDISVVMKNQSDLVDILVELSPLAVVKG